MATELTMPPLGEGIESADVLEVKASEGDSVKAGQTLVVVQAEKVTAELEAPQAGRVAKVLVKNGDTLKVGQPYIALQEVDAKREAAPVKTQEEPGKTQMVDGAGAKPPPAAVQRVQPDGEPIADKLSAVPATAVVPAGPATRMLARKLGVDLNHVSGSGRGGRITQEDVEAYVRELASGEKRQRTPAAASPALPDFSKWGAVERQDLDPIRRRTAEQMHRAWSLIPHVTQHDRADVTELDAFRKQAEVRGPKLTVTAFALKAAAIALRQFPRFNASLDLAGGALVLKRHYHIGVAVDTEHGLLVPVIRDVDKKSVLHLAGELADLAERARQRKLQVDQMRGGTFTITNLGGIGGTGFTPIINWPEVAILGLSRAHLEPVVREGQVTARLMLPLSLSYDHRVLDGADAARFTRRVAEMLESGWNMVLHG
jgi:pyruvate dehydrogenase E2 component (dihydrolipoamide acetyltransferase)